MSTFLDWMERATTGPILTEDDFYLKVLIPNIRKAVKEYGLRYDPANPVPSDDELARRLFEATVQFIAETGLYCSATNRVIHVERAEVMEAVQNVSGGGTFGEGRDRRTLLPRRPEDVTPPWCHVGTGIVASSEEIAMAQVEGYGSLRHANSISIPAFGRVRGMPVMGGSPLEIYATVASVQAARKALWKCGRPVLPKLNLISSATTSMATIAGSHPAFGLRPSDGWLIDFIAEMKVNFETLNRLAFILITGGNVGSTSLPILGGYAGGAAGTAVVMTAYHLLGMLLFQGAYQLTGPVHFRYACSTTRDGLWIFSVVGRATSLYTRYPAIALGYGAAGPCTRMYFYEAAAVNLACVTSGYAGIQTVHPAKAIIEDGVTPMEARFNVEAAYAATGMKAEQANEIVNRLLAKYEQEIERAPSGKRYQECFDVRTGQPSDEYIRLYDEIKEELLKIGIPFQS
jgi:hypothetical protein